MYRWIFIVFLFCVISCRKPELYKSSALGGKGSSEYLVDKNKSAGISRDNDLKRYLDSQRKKKKHKSKAEKIKPWDCPTYKLRE